MWPVDIKMALFGIDNDLIIEKIEDGFIFFTNHKCFTIKGGVKAYQMAMSGDYSEFDKINKNLKREGL